MADKDINVNVASGGGDSPDLGEMRPWTMVLEADFHSEGRLKKLTAIDKESFAQVLAAARPQIAMAIKDPLGSGGGDWEFRLTLDSMNAFAPAGLLPQIPHAKRRLELRGRIRERQTGQLSSAQLDEAVGRIDDPSLRWVGSALAATGEAAATAPSDAGDDSTGSSLLDMVDAPTAGDRVAADVEKLVADVSNRDAKVSGGEAGRLGAVLARLDTELSRIADAVLHHDGFRAIEGAWRGAKYLVDRVDFREGVRLAIVDAKRDEAVARFSEQVVQPCMDGDIPAPGLVLMDHAFSNTAVDIAWLDELAQHAASLPVPVFVPVEPEFFNVRTVALIKNLPNLASLTGEWQFAKWKALRDKNYSCCIAPVVGRFVLRAPYEASTARAGEFAYSETVAYGTDVLWGGGHLAAGVCAARSYAQYAWPTRMFGSEAGKVEDLPVIASRTQPDTTWGPGDGTLPNDKCFEFADAGMNILQSVRGKDYCILLGGVSMARWKKTAEVTENQARLEVSVPYQMFSNVIGSYLCDERPRLHGLSDAELQARLVLGLRGLMGLVDNDAEDAVMIGVAPSADDPMQRVVAVRLNPPVTIVPGGLHVEMGFSVGA